MLIGEAILSLAACSAVAWLLHRRNMERWLLPCLRKQFFGRRPKPDDDVHLLLCVADHYEPKAQRVSKERGLERVRHWVKTYPSQFSRFRDSDGRTPCHTFFFPIEEYEPEYLDLLAELCRQGYGEVEIHLHHDGATSEGLRQQLIDFRDLLAQRHGLLSRHKLTQELAYAFIHGNWALCNSGPGGALCGVNDELEILRSTGCYVDMTFPSAPNANQPPKVSAIYYATDKPGRPRSHETGCDVGVGPQPANSLMLLTGPLRLDFGNCKWGVLPRLENGCLQKSQPPKLRRIDQWLRAGVQVPSRPDWFFVKLHAHGAPEECHETLLGEPMVRLHEALASRARANPRFHYHYVSAREMYNLAKAAEAGFHGSVAEARDFLLQKVEKMPCIVTSNTSSAP
jgi:hypothetical protein